MTSSLTEVPYPLILLLDLLSASQPLQKAQECLLGEFQYRFYRHTIQLAAIAISLTSLLFNQ